jgi:hypothetical protein
VAGRILGGLAIVAAASALAATPALAAPACNPVYGAIQASS